MENPNKYAWNDNNLNNLHTISYENFKASPSNSCSQVTKLDKYDMSVATINDSNNNISNSKEEPKPIVIHRIQMNEDCKCEVVMMPQVNKVLKNVFQIMSQANYYLQKYGIVAKRFSGEHLMRLKILGLLKNDVKVCSYIKYEQSQTLMNSFSSNAAIRKNGTYCYSSLICLEAATGDLEHLFNSHNLNKMEDIHTSDMKNIILGSVYRNGAIFVSVDSIIEVIKEENRSVLEQLILEKSFLTITLPDKPVLPDTDPAKMMAENRFVEKTALVFIMKYFLPHRTDLDFASCIMYKNMDIYSDNNAIQTETVNRANLKLEPLSGEGTNQTFPKDDEIFINIYLLNGEKIVAMPDINNIIKLAQGYTKDDIPGVHGALLRQVNYYLGKLKTQKRRFNFTQMKAVKRYGTCVGSATYCSYILLADAWKILEVFKTFNMKFPVIFDRITWKGPFSIDESTNNLLGGNSKGVSKKKIKTPKLQTVFKFHEFEKYKIRYYSHKDVNYVNLREMETFINNVMDSNQLNEHLSHSTIKMYIKNCEKGLSRYKLKEEAFTTTMDIYMRLMELKNILRLINCAEKGDLRRLIVWVPGGSLFEKDFKDTIFQDKIDNHSPIDKRADITENDKVLEKNNDYQRKTSGILATSLNNVSYEGVDDKQQIKSKDSKKYNEIQEKVAQLEVMIFKIKKRLNQIKTSINQENIDDLE